MSATRAPLTPGRVLFFVVVGVAGCVLTATLALAFGSSAVGPVELLSALLGGADSTTDTILFRARLPRVVLAMSVGAALATSGAIFQAVLRNPLADPYILGVSGGAALGATLFMATGLAALPLISIAGVPGAAFAGSLFAVALIFAVGRWAPGRGGTYVLLLSGVIFNAFASSVIMFFKSVVTAEKAQELLFYLMGTLAVEGIELGAIWAVSAIIVVAICVLFGLARDLNALSLGDDEAATLGVDVERTRRVGIGLSATLVAVAVAYTGLIGFVGLVVPHAVRLATGPDHRAVLPVAALGGAIFLTTCDLIARTSFSLFETTIPVGVVTSFIGAPLFIYFLRRAFLAGEVPG